MRHKILGLLGLGSAIDRQDNYRRESLPYSSRNFQDTKMQRSLSQPTSMHMYNDGGRKSPGRILVRNSSTLSLPSLTSHRWPKRKIRRYVTLLALFLAMFLVMVYMVEDGEVKCETDIVYGKNSSASLETQRKGMRVLLSTGAYNNIVDGVSRTLNRLVEYLIVHGFQVLVVAPTGDKPALQHYGALLPAPGMKIPFRREYSIATGLDTCLMESLREFDPDIVHIATPDPLGSQIQNWAIERKLPVVCSFHTRFASYLPYYVSGRTLTAVSDSMWWWLKKFYNSCDHIYPPTNLVQDELVDHGMRNDTMRIWARGINLDTFSPDHRSEELRAEWNVTDDTVVVLFVSRMVWEKNLHPFVDTMLGLQEANVSFKAVFVGIGPAINEVQKLLPDAHYMGYAGGMNLSRAYASADIFFFPSVTETWGAVAVEAMASGLAVVVAGGPGAAELVDDGKTGLIINASNQTATTQTMKELVENTTLRRRIRTTGLDHARHRHSWTWDAANAMLTEHYQEVYLQNKIEKFGWLALHETMDEHQIGSNINGMGSDMVHNRIPDRGTT
eukprot:m.309777 g.309777  ORF g.309777 m.309777 type:complete len:558 (-) comp20203_c0_seq1:146-1819(-)